MILALCFDLVLPCGEASGQGVIGVFDIGPEDYKGRRDLLRSKIPSESFAVILSSPQLRVIGSMVEIPYIPNANMRYFTGYSGPGGLLLVFSEPTNVFGASSNEVLFVKEVSPLRELYDGSWVSLDEIVETSGLSSCYSFDRTDSVDWRPLSSLKPMIPLMEKRVVLPDDILGAFLQKLPSSLSKKISKGHPKFVRYSHQVDSVIKSLREIKSRKEIALLREAVSITIDGHLEVMGDLEMGQSEISINDGHLSYYHSRGVPEEAFPSIIAAGVNGTILHYRSRSTAPIEGNQLVLMDVGAKYRNYRADLTRTVPITGRFTEDQKKIYDLVLEAQTSAADICKPGVDFSDLYDATEKVIHEGLEKLGIAVEDNPSTGRNWYYPHGCSHHIGLEVHDGGHYKKLEPGMVFTIEPGIYIPPSSPAAPRWWALAVRIEDDYLVLEDSCEKLSEDLPATTEEIEAFMSESR